MTDAIRAGLVAFAVRSIVAGVAAFMFGIATMAAVPVTVVPTPSPTPTQPSMLGVLPSASRVTVTVIRIDRSLPIGAAHIAVVARDGTGTVVRTARAFDDPSLFQTPEQPRFAFAFDPPLSAAIDPYTIEAKALDLGFGGSARLVVVPVPANIGRLGDPFIATWWSAGATPGEPFAKRAAPDGTIAYVSRDGKRRFAAPASGFYPEFADDDVDRLRAMFYGHDAVGPGLFVWCENRRGDAMNAKLLSGRRIRIEEIGRAAHGSERIADDPTRSFGSGSGIFVDSPIVAEFRLAPGDAAIESSGMIMHVQTNIDPTCVRGFAVFQNAAQMLTVFSRA